MIRILDYKNFIIEILPYVKYPIDKLLLLGCGILNADRSIKAETKLAIDWADDRLLKIKEEKGLIPIKFDIKYITNILVPKSFDTVVMFDFIEHLEKADGEKLLDNIENSIKKQILMFTPLENTKQDVERTIKLQKQRKEQNLSLGHHCSQWTPEEMDKRGFDVLVSPNYHKERNWGAMICIKNL